MQFAQKILALAFAVTAATSTWGADSGDTPLAGGDGVLLKFSPEIGRTYQYSYSVDLDKTTFGKTTRERMSALFLLHIINKEDEIFQTRWGVIPGGHNLLPESMDKLKEQAAQGRAYAISERYVFSPDEGQSLFLPSSPVRLGASWKGQPIFRFGDLSTSKPPPLECEYRLVRLESTPAGPVAVIEATPIEKQLTVPLESGLASAVMIKGTLPNCVKAAKRRNT